MTYRQVNNPLGAMNAVQRIEDGAFIPMDNENADYQVYQTWLAAGNTPLPPAG